MLTASRNLRPVITHNRVRPSVVVRASRPGGRWRLSSSHDMSHDVDRALIELSTLRSRVATWRASRAADDADRIVEEDADGEDPLQDDDGFSDPDLGFLVEDIVAACDRLGSCSRLVSHAASVAVEEAVTTSLGGKGTSSDAANGGPLVLPVVVQRLLEVARGEGGRGRGGGEKKEGEGRRRPTGKRKRAADGGESDHGACRALLLLRQAVKREAAVVKEEEEEEAEAEEEEKDEDAGKEDTRARAATAGLVAAAVSCQLPACLQPCVAPDEADDLRLYAALRLISSLVVNRHDAVAHATRAQLSTRTRSHSSGLGGGCDEDEDEGGDANTTTLTALMHRALRLSSPAYVAHAGLTLLLQVYDGSCAVAFPSVLPSPSESVFVLHALRQSGLLQWPEREDPVRYGAPSPFLERERGRCGGEDSLRRRAWLVVARLRALDQGGVPPHDWRAVTRDSGASEDAEERLEWPVPAWATNQAQAAEALVKLFAGEDDMLVELLDASRSLASREGGCAPDPHHVFVATLRALSWGHSVLLDMLVAPGGERGGADVREYMLRYLRLAAAEPGAFLAACSSGGAREEGEEDGDVEAACECLRELHGTVTRLAERGLMPYNPAPLVCRLRTFLDAVELSRLE